MKLYLSLFFGLLACINISADDQKQYFRLKINNKESKVFFTATTINQFNKRIIVRKNLKKLFEIGGMQDTVLYSPSGIITDKKGNIFVLDYVGKFAKKFSSKGKFINKYGRPGKGPGEFLYPAKIYLDEKDSVYIYDSSNNILTAFLKNVKQIHMKAGTLAVEFCPLNEKNIIVLKSSIKSPKILEKYDINSKLLNEFTEIFDIKSLPRELFLIGHLLKGKILKISSTKFVHIPDYFNQMFFYNNNKIEKVISTLDKPTYPLFKMELSSNKYNMSFNELDKYVINFSSFIIDKDIYIVSNQEMKGNSLLVDIYKVSDGIYKHSLQIPLTESFHLVHMTKNRIYMITTDLKLKVFSYE